MRQIKRQTDGEKDNKPEREMERRWRDKRVKEMKGKDRQAQMDR